MAPSIAPNASGTWVNVLPHSNWLGFSGCEAMFEAGRVNETLWKTTVVLLAERQQQLLGAGNKTRPGFGDLESSDSVAVEVAVKATGN